MRYFSSYEKAYIKFFQSLLIAPTLVVVFCITILGGVIRVYNLGLKPLWAG